jgi:hypothetical protein
MTDVKVTRTCNRHFDCDKAEQEVKERWEANWKEQYPGQTKRFPGVSASFHCHDDECEECFGN